MTEAEETGRQREAFVAECREKIRNGQEFSKADKVGARVLNVDLAELREDEEEEVHRERYAG